MDSLMQYLIKAIFNASGGFCFWNPHVIERCPFALFAALETHHICVLKRVSSVPSILEFLEV